MKILISEKISQHKSKTPEGYLICLDSILARTGKQEYMKCEVYPECDDTSMIEVDRKAEQVFDKNTLASFENKPITVEHPDENVTPENYRDYSVGFVRDIRQSKVDGQDVMIGNLIITDAQTIEEIENGEHCELSCGYDCDITEGDHPEQINIRGNHIALCEQGRAGIARIVDSMEKQEFRLTKKKNDYDEYVIKAYINGKYYEEATYYTDDWEDAVATLNEMAKKAHLTVKKTASGFIADSKIKDVKATLGKRIKNEYKIYSEEEIKNAVEKLHEEKPYLSIEECEDIVHSNIENGNHLLDSKVGDVSPELEAKLEEWKTVFDNAELREWKPELQEKFARKLEFLYGPKWIKAIASNKFGDDKFVFAFVDPENGDIYKPASWNAPAKKARANVFKQFPVSISDLYANTVSAADDGSMVENEGTIIENLLNKNNIKFRKVSFDNKGGNVIIDFENGVTEQNLNKAKELLSQEYENIETKLQSDYPFPYLIVKTKKMTTDEEDATKDIFINDKKITREDLPYEYKNYTIDYDKDEDAYFVKVDDLVIYYDSIEDTIDGINHDLPKKSHLDDSKYSKKFYEDMIKALERKLKKIDERDIKVEEDIKEDYEKNLKELRETIEKQLEEYKKELEKQDK